MRYPLPRPESSRSAVDGVVSRKRIVHGRLDACDFPNGVEVFGMIAEKQTTAGHNN